MMPDPGSPWERPNPSDGFGYLPWPIKSDDGQALWDACRAHYAQVDTLPKGRDAKQGSVGTKGSAVAEGHAPNPVPSHIPLMNKDSSRADR